MKNLTVLLVCLLVVAACQTPPETISSEKDVPAYRLPEILLTAGGMPVESATAWEKERRDEIRRIFEKEVYGDFPDGDYQLTFEEGIQTDTFLNQSAILKEVRAFIETAHGKHHFSMLLVLPKSDRPVPVFTALNFYGNHTIDTSSLITIHDAWVRNNEAKKTENNRATEASRGSSAERWPLRLLTSSGYGLCTVYYGELDPDYDDGYTNGLHPLFAQAGIPRSEHSSGAISIWAKGMSMMIDYLETDSLVDEGRIIALGHSRLGKTSLWAGANDERFAAVISNNSGCGGAALFRREFGERIHNINGMFPHWFCGQFKEYNLREHRLPVDQHMLLALIAPRPVYVASATEDLWADPRGEFLALKAALPVYRLYEAGLEFPPNQPAPGEPFHGTTGYHLRPGPHNITEYDWQQYIRWADTLLKRGNR